MARLFGTDGVRGIANADLSCELTFRIGQAGALLLSSELHHPKILIARDSRISGEMLRFALTAGINSVGADAVDLGMLPTPAAAHLVRAYEADAAVVISASHNSFEYNGIKWFNREGFKLSDEMEDRMEAIVRGEMLAGLPIEEKIGSAIRAHNAIDEYIDSLFETVQQDYSGMKIVLDCANGAASNAAPRLFQRFGAEVVTCFDSPDGVNINAGCGSTHPERLQRKVVELGADVGFAFDGDADRLIAVDEFGRLIDGDVMLSICAVDMKAQNKLAKDTVVATVMSNLGMKLSMKKQGIQVLETDVGDRYVLERMCADGYNLGGEQSGHMIFLDNNTTGDGMLSSLRILDVMTRSKEKLSDLAEICEIYPQTLLNVEVTKEGKAHWQEDEILQKRMQQTEELLGENGRLLVRASGTEPLLRIMIEGKDAGLIQAEAEAIAHCVIDTLGGKIRS